MEICYADVFVAVGILAWLFALTVLWIFAESGGAPPSSQQVFFAGLAIVSLGLERVLELLEEIRDRGLSSAPIVTRDAARDGARDAEMRERTVAALRAERFPRNALSFE